MTRDEWIGLGTSVGVHLGLLLLCAFLTAGRPATPALGALHLELGSFAQGRPVQQSTTPADEAEPTEAQPSTAPSPSVSDAEDAAANSDASPAQEAEGPQEEPPEASAPVNLPEQDPPAGEEPPPEEPPTKPEREAPPAQQTAERPPSDANAADAGSAGEEQAASEAEGGQATGGATGAATGDEGEASDEDRAAPFDIEGLDRTRLYGAMPEYTEKVEATIKIRITVSPDGRVIGQEPVLKANPSLERSVMEALRQWRFNRLPSGAPQRPQTGIVTFRFRLE